MVCQFFLFQENLCDLWLYKLLLQCRAKGLFGSCHEGPSPHRGCREIETLVWSVPVLSQVLIFRKSSYIWDNCWKCTNSAPIFVADCISCSQSLFTFHNIVLKMHHTICHYQLFDLSYIRWLTKQCICSCVKPPSLKKAVQDPDTDSRTMHVK